MINESGMKELVRQLEEEFMDPDIVEDYYVITKNEKGEENRINGKEYYDKHIRGDTIDNSK